MTNKKSTWYYKDMKDFFNPWLWLLAFVTSIIANIISFFTGWTVENIIGTILGVALLCLIIPWLVHGIRNKINNIGGKNE